MKGSIDIIKHLENAIKTAYQHGPMSWTQLRVMIAIIDPVLDAVLSKRYDEPDINRNIFNTLFEVACIQVHLQSEDKTIYKYMQDTMLQLFLTQDYVTMLDLNFINLKMLVQRIKLTTDDEFSKKLQRVINNRTKISVSDEKLTEKMMF